MSKFFGAGRSDHPMADPREARRLLEELSARDDQALEELTHWQESLAGAEGFRPERRFQLVAQVDEAAQPRLHPLPGGKRAFELKFAGFGQVQPPFPPVFPVSFCDPAVAVHDLQRSGQRGAVH